jgi:phosphatidylglycerol:prolipoprotein diacylglycerol transferase
MYPILFSLGKISFYSYGFFVSIAFLASFIIIYQLNNKKITAENLIDKLFIVLVAGIIGARLVYVALYPEFISHWWQALYFWQGGLVSYGGIFGGLLAYIFIFKKDLCKNLDILSVGFLIGLFFWRIGCTLAGDHPTMFSHSWFSINGTIPVPLFESLSGLIGFILASIFYKKKILASGILFFITFFYYGLIRFIIDRWRIDEYIGNYTIGQITGLIIMIVSTVSLIIFIYYRKINSKKLNK